MSRQVSWNAHEADFKEAVEALSNVEEVEVTKDTWTDATGFDFYHWTVSASCSPLTRSNSGLFADHDPNPWVG